MPMVVCHRSEGNPRVTPTKVGRLAFVVVFGGQHHHHQGKHLCFLYHGVLQVPTHTNVIGLSPSSSAEAKPGGSMAEMPLLGENKEMQEEGKIGRAHV